MPDFEILHSGQYWQDLRRRAKAASDARVAAAARADSFAPILGDGATIITFTPGCSVPITSVQYPNGRIVPISGSPTLTPSTRSACARPRPRVRGTNSILASRSRDDEILLARFAEKRKRDEEAESSGWAQKKRKAAKVSMVDLG
ncbi:hypothetical protein B0H11DRAFT_2254347 [Mycena galericulata]|nr:hypothetical protein B0H11DRAFT_2254347 [Mycena galericulata]